jgi:hypothetical protein
MKRGTLAGILDDSGITADELRSLSLRNAPAKTVAVRENGKKGGRPRTRTHKAADIPVENGKPAE